MKPILLAIAAASILILPIHKVQKIVQHNVPKQGTIVKLLLPKKGIDCERKPVASGTTNYEYFLHDIFFLVKF